MNRRIPIAVVALSMMLFVTTVWSQSSDDEAALKTRFKARYSTLMDLKDQGKVGETSLGLAEAVNPSHLDEKIDPKSPQTHTIATFLAAENSDREALYRLVAKRTSVNAEDVAKRNAKRLWQKARPLHFLKRADGAWIRKRDIKKQGTKARR